MLKRSVKHPVTSGDDERSDGDCFCKTLAVVRKRQLCYNIGNTKGK